MRRIATRKRRTPEEGTIVEETSINGAFMEGEGTSGIESWDGDETYARRVMEEGMMIGK